MPKLFEYFGLIILFYSNEHEPIHVHCKYQGREGKAELIVEDGQVIDIRISIVKLGAKGHWNQINLEILN